MLRIGPHILKNRLVLAPMAGVTDRPFRKLCKNLGAAMAVSEMVGSRSLIEGSKKTLRRADHAGETGIKSVQIVGACPQMMAEAAAINEEMGAEIIDINMGCPAKKVCNMLSGSSLLRDEPLVESILTAVVKSVSIPVTLKIRTGWDQNNKNALTIARIAENSGIQALSIHGRTRSCFFRGEAEYDTIAYVKQNIKIPVLANGDIDTPEKAKFVLDYTKADGLLIGRAAQGKPWIFREINHFIDSNQILPEPSKPEIGTYLLGHLEELYNFYGTDLGIKIARKHVSWYSKNQSNSANFRQTFHQLNCANGQRDLINEFFNVESNKIL